ncbi:MAG TPA: helix-hairpin-helix domain-containing protein [Bacteroidia bacterium]|nr:helix-hairpin-helix domain-containing protein [Bacteroidia bacterium]
MLNYIAKYFTLNRRERNGVFVLISILFITVLVKYFVVYHYQTKTSPVVMVELDEASAKLLTQDILSPKGNYSNTTSSAPQKKKLTLFHFDPNTISEMQALELGFEKRCVLQLINYRNKGGKFYKPADLEKLYCMDKELFTHLEPYIIIEGTKKKEQSSNSKNNFSAKKENKAQNITIEINSADSTDWVKLKGIGTGYARRILKYKSLLGGFTNVEQLKEVYNFPDSLFNSIKGNLTVNPVLILKLKINTVDFKTMVHHPYIKYEGTKCIFALKRNKKIKEEDLTGSSCFSRELLQKLLPYFDFE